MLMMIGQKGYLKMGQATLQNLAANCERYEADIARYEAWHKQALERNSQPAIIESRRALATAKMAYRQYLARLKK
jgi:hypothetical protein